MLEIKFIDIKLTFTGLNEINLVQTLMITLTDSSLIEKYGSGMSRAVKVAANAVSSRVGNSVRGVSRSNPAGRGFHLLSNQYFGPLAPYTGY